MRKKCLHLYVSQALSSKLGLEGGGQQVVISHSLSMVSITATNIEIVVWAQTTCCYKASQPYLKIS